MDNNLLAQLYFIACNVHKTENQTFIAHKVSSSRDYLHLHLFKANP